MTQSKLKTYRQKRDFRKTAEPSGQRAPRSSAKPVFVIQKHDAQKLHYDFRLEAGGVLKSWAVPKGPSTDPRERRLAVRTEDHPLEYADFEGVIPEKEYGGGTVLVWDKGTYENCTRREPDGQVDEPLPVEKALAEGFIEFRLNGEKLRGGYVLKRFGEEGGNEQWLLIKTKDDEADARRNPVSTEPASVQSGRMLKEIAAGGKEDDRQ